MPRKPNPDDFWIAWQPTLWLTGVAELTCEERGAYDTIINHFYDKRGRVRLDRQFLAGYCRLSVRRFNQILARLLELEKLEIITVEIHRDDGRSPEIREYLWQEKAGRTLIKRDNLTEIAKIIWRKSQDKTGEKSAETAGNCHSEVQNDVPKQPNKRPKRGDKKNRVKKDSANWREGEGTRSGLNGQRVPSRHIKTDRPVATEPHLNDISDPALRSHLFNEWMEGRWDGWADTRPEEA